MKVKNNNEYTHSVGYQNEEGKKANYVLNPGESIEIPVEHIYLFKDIEGISTEEVTNTQSEDKSEVKEEVSTPKKEVESTDKPEVFVCPECGNEFTAKIALSGHMRSHQKVEEKKEDNGSGTN